MFTGLDEQQTYILFAIDFDGESHVEHSGNWWSVMYSIMYLAQNPKMYSETIHSLSLYVNVGYYVLNAKRGGYYN